MTNKEIDAAFYNIRMGQHIPADIDAIENELNIYKKMALRLERCVHELVKENDKAREELKDMDNQINLRCMATNAMEKATARLDEALEVKSCQS